MAVTVWLSRTGDDPRPVARALLIRAAARMLNLPADAIEVAHEPGGRPYLGGGKRDFIWRCWNDGCTVAEFVMRAREVCNGGPEDVRTDWHSGVIRLEPQPSAPIWRPR